MKLMTWNMQGAGTSTSPKAKWQRLASWLLSQQPTEQPSVIALQECGVLPNKLPGQVHQVQEFNPGGWPVPVYQWHIQDGNVGRVQDFFVSYVDLDNGGNRVNLAVLSQGMPSDVITTYAEYRTALGVAIDGIGYFSLHASAAGGWDIEELLANIWTSIGCGPWIAMGDYNKEPKDLLLRGETLSQPTRDCGLNGIAPSLYTHPRQPAADSTLRIIDYAVQTRHVGITQAARFDMGLSDHYAVLFS